MENKVSPDTRPSSQLTDPELVERFRALEKAPVTRYLGFRLITLDSARGTARCEFTATAEMANAIGGIHGGMLAAMLDTAMTAAALARSKLTMGFPTLEMKLSYVDRALPGTIVGEGKVVRFGKTIVFLEGALLRPDGALIATGSATTRSFVRDPQGRIDSW